MRKYQITKRDDHTQQMTVCVDIIDKHAQLITIMDIQIDGDFEFFRYFPWHIYSIVHRPDLEKWCFDSSEMFISMYYGDVDGEREISVNPTPPVANNYMYFEAIEANSTVSMLSILPTAPDFEYSTDGETWQEWQYTTEDRIHIFDTLTLTAVGDRVYLRGDNPNGLGEMIEENSDPAFSIFVTTGALNGGGNIMSLLDSNMEITEVPQFGFYYLFATFIGETENVLHTAPAMNTITTIGDYGCHGMYEGCTPLTAASDMPSLTTIGDYGCCDMYFNCTSLITAAEMPVLTTIGNYSCYGMYLNCTSLTAASDMPSLTTIGERGCEGMYRGDTSLITAASIPSLTTIGDYGCCDMYFSTSLTAASDMPSLTTIGGNGCKNMYYYCTFEMSDDGTTFNFAFEMTLPVTAGLETFYSYVGIADWMGNTNGFY